MSVRLAELIQSHQLGADQAMILSLGGLMLMVGVAFKLSAVPFHFWAPDVFEGATAEVAAFLSVASKVAALGLLVRLAADFSFPLDHSFGALAAMVPLRLYLDAAAPVRQYICAPDLGAGRGDLHLRQSGGLRADEHEAAAGLFHHRPRRLHDDARGRGRRPGGRTDHANSSEPARRRPSPR